MATVKVFLLVLTASCLLEIATAMTYSVLNFADQTHHADCGSLQRAGYNTSGVYRLVINNKMVMLPCEFRGGAAFTMILQRTSSQAAGSSKMSFKQPWVLYEAGFGTPHYDFWAGLQHIYVLTVQGNNRLHVNMQDWSGNNKTAFYSTFFLGNRQTRYKLNVGDFYGTAVDALGYHNQMPFSTYDFPDPRGCSTRMHAGWWYNNCALCLPTGAFYTTATTTTTNSTQMSDRMFWMSWQQRHGYSIKYISMSIGR